jgi:hypothetical protein
MKYWTIVLALLVVMIFTGSAMAYSGFNRYYYTDNYVPSVYYPTPAYVGYGYPSVTVTSGYSYYPSIVYNTTYYKAAPVIAYASPVYVTPVYPAYSNTGMAFYSGTDGWGFSLYRGSTCAYYGYC